VTLHLDPDGADLLTAYAASVLPIYAPTDGTLRRDEMVDDARSMRPSWRGVGEVLTELGLAGLSGRRAAIARLLEDDGVTYHAQNQPAEQPWTLDPLPLLIDEDDWAPLERGLIQRAELFDDILTDLYGPRRLIRDGLLPPAVIFGHSGFLRDADQIRVPGARQLFLAAADLARDADGAWRVLGDRIQAPSGAGYAMENRSVLSRALPGLYRGTGVHRIAPYFRTMRESLQRLAPHPHQLAGAPRVVLLSPGSGSETAFDQAFLSSLLGLPLVVGADLLVRDGRVWHRSLDRLEPVDVIMRRVDADFCDPLELRPDSQLGVPGLLEVARAGGVSIVNSVGAGVLENPGLVPYLPGICRALRGEDLQLRSATTHWCGERDSRQHVLANLPRLVIKPIARAVDRSSRLGWELSERELAELVRQISAEPHAWVGQEPLAMSTAPTLRETALQPRSIVLRTFAVSDGTTYQVMPGGLTRAPLAPDTVMVSNATGAVSKDVWVLSSVTPAGDDLVAVGLLGPETVSAAVSPRVAEDLFWLGRYAERAESLTRLLRVVDNRWRDMHPAPDPALARCAVSLLEALTAVTATWPGFAGEGAGARLAAPQAELLSLIADESRTGTLAHDLNRIRSLANAVRDQLSADTWMVLSGLDRGLLPFTNARSSTQLDGSDAQYGPPSFRSSDELSDGLAHLLQATLAFSGLMAESMVRDAGWYLLDAGRRLERAMQVSALLRYTLTTAYPAEAQQLVVESVLIAAESIITHRRRYPARGGVDTVLELLITDRGNPRSVAFQLDRLEDDLRHTPAAEHTMGQARKLSHALGERLQSADCSGLVEVAGDERPSLLTFLDEVGEELRRLYLLIATAHFVHPAALRPLDPYAVLEAV
jgi:uncharacterized circularly permuted ATP-grasp superfamily protein/uncharacterized alpha-E superfamily protein